MTRSVTLRLEDTQMVDDLYLVTGTPSAAKQQASATRAGR